MGLAMIGLIARVITGAGGMDAIIAMEADELASLLPAGLAFTPTTIAILIAAGVITAVVGAILLRKYLEDH
jgi:uncharacterized membrane protein